eukprot:TRINITY_DN15359_c0_g1_i2.p1 TRINITY_DN15359_c0_g1~~TRINITY_DN15359_c0_g1_i2.p1  ORF type:complete len:185 (-),score=36.76 TRINITY_DN15359_c0_g1_i2:93-647(-)
MKKNHNKRKYLGLVQIGYHQDVQVVYGTRVKEQIECINRKQTIDQVFCAAVNLSQGKTGQQNRKLPLSEERSRLILEAAYHATYLAAIHYGRTHLFLTLLGAGAFGNNTAWVYDAIFKAHKRWGNHPKSCLAKVTLVLYDRRLATSKFFDGMRQDKLPFRYVVYKNCVEIVEESFGTSPPTIFR